MIERIDLVIGVIDHGTSKNFYVDLAEYGKGANLGCSVILMSIIQHVQTLGYLPPRLNLQSDNTAADYKNSVTFQTLGYLVSRGVFDEVSRVLVRLLYVIQALFLCIILSCHWYDYWRPLGFNYFSYYLPYYVETGCSF